MNTSNKEKIRKRFSEKAGSYDKSALVQKGMAHQISRRLASVENKEKRILEIGCGTGYLTRLLLHQHPKSEYLALDLAEGMIRVAEKQFSHEHKRCRFLVADAEEWLKQQEEASFDLIVSNACFQWLEQRDETMRYLYQSLTKKGRLVFTTFGPDTFRELHASFCKAYQSLGIEKQEKHGLSYPGTYQWREILTSSGFQNVKIQAHTEILHYPSVWDFLYAIKSIGASTSQATNTKGLGNKKLIFEMMNHYDKMFRCEQGIPASYEIYVIEGERLV